MSIAAPPGVVSEVLLTEQQIQERVRALGAAISSDYAGLNPILVGVLRGVALFLADLMRAITIPMAVDFLAINNYGAQQQPGAVRILKDLEQKMLTFCSLVEDCCPLTAPIIAWVFDLYAPIAA